jgi:hypothetical protein
MADGIFDPLLVPGAWFDETVIPLGWFDEDFVEGASTGGAGYTLSVTAASITLTGQTVGLRVERKLAVTAAFVTLAGQNVTFRRGYRLSVTAAAVSLTGQDVALRAARRLSVSLASVSLAGQSVSLLAGRKLAVSPASVAVTGQDVSFVHTVPGAYGITLSHPGTITLTGGSLNLTYTPAQPQIIQRGGGSGRKEYEKRQKEWRDDLKRIIEDAFVAVAGGTTEPVTVAEKREIAAAVLPVADMSGIQASLTEIMRLVNEYEAERRRKAEEEDDELLLLLAA